MQHLDEGTIHAWLDGELLPAEREALEAHIAECEQCAAAVAEARGFVAASSRILLALDTVPGGVLPAASTGSSAARPPVHRRFVASRAWMAAAAVLVLSTVTVIAIRPSGDTAQLRVAAASRDQKELSGSTAPSEEKTPAVMSSAKPQVADSHAIGAVEPVAPLSSDASKITAPASSNAVSRNAPTTMQSRAAAPAAPPAPADERKTVDQTERLKSRLEAERQSTRVRPSNGAPAAMADAAPPPRIAESPATPPTALADAKDTAEKREAAASVRDSTSELRTPARAQDVTITGRVTNDVGTPLASASVVLEGTGIAALTRDDGTYALRVPAERANGQTISLVARLIGYKAGAAPIAPTGTPITHDFVLVANPLALGEVIVTGEGTTGAIANKSSRAANVAKSKYRLLPNGERAEIVSHTSSAVSGEPVEVTTYRVKDEYITFIDRLKPDTTRRALEKDSSSPLLNRQDAYVGTINSITWTDSVGRIRTLQGAVPTRELERLKQLLFGARP